ncbi:MAG TPA: biotin carboxylase N-terminal domain-containing protein [Phycicoccus sp.]|jgi:propionyl-CoA carboxylase alpha chain|nr:biotin carboxylase N-terminal domain-containing protein [Phycicoccus sp.]HRA45193.1 biotin carboxylase N-terminal domain-containing protein [Phycicoccus sp.]
MTESAIAARPITSVLVANRGEIARRVFVTCRALGLRTVAVFSDADATAPHVTEADVAVRLPGTAATDTYLRGDLVIAAAQRAGADAIHPGYGFLSENADFAEAVEAAGLTWIGPPPSAIRAMGGKVEAKRLMGEAGVPMLDSMDPGTITEADLPVLVKASAGGGGRGMRIVRTLSDLPAALDAARAEAASAFGDSTVFVEHYVESGHHIEVQVMADRHGTVWAVGERECSIQRRHQKVIEEAPAPLVERHPQMREPLYAAARDAAAAIDYVGAGTVEFLADDEGRFWFLEMNTRLQVEHPVTELTTGLDLVALQLAVAQGEPLPSPNPPAASGSSIEVRLYAEDPAQDWQPQSGTLTRLDIPGITTEFGPLPSSPATVRPGLRLDSGVVDGSEVSIHYDPMLAKVISWAPTRAAAARLLAEALTRAQIHGLRTNRDLLVRVLSHPDFVAGATDTAFLDRHGLEALAAPLLDAGETHLAALAAALADTAYRRSVAVTQPGLPAGWRNLPSGLTRKTFTHSGGDLEISYAVRRGTLIAPAHEGVALVSAEPGRVVLDVDGLRRTWRIARDGDAVEVDTDRGAVTFRRVPLLPDVSDQVAEGSLVAPLPGVVTAVHVAVGDEVAKGQALLVLEAMKMQHTITAPANGAVASLEVEVGRHVEVGAVLAVIDTDDDTDETEEGAE